MKSNLHSGINKSFIALRGSALPSVFEGAFSSPWANFARILKDIEGSFLGHVANGQAEFFILFSSCHEAITKCRQRIGSRLWLVGDMAKRAAIFLIVFQLGMCRRGILLWLSATNRSADIHIIESCIAGATALALLWSRYFDILLLSFVGI